MYSRPAIERVPPHDQPHVVISITTTADDQARIPQGPMCREILRLSFPDVDSVIEGYSESDLFAADDAARVWALVLGLGDEITRVVLHCDAGMSRSPGMAAALSKVLNGDDTEFFRRYRPNMRVYRTMLNAYEERFAAP